LSVELHLPDLPEVPISLGPAADAPPRAPTPWHLRLRDALSSYLPLLLMALLALATWWLVKNSPRPEAARPVAAVSSEPDYTMSQFAVERFDATGRLKLRIEGAQIRAYAPDGRVTLATAKRALGNGDGSEIQLLGGAEVTAQDGSGVPLVMKGEFLHAFLITERVKTHLPVSVRQGGSEFRAAGLEYDHAARRLDLKGPLRAVLSPRPAPAASASLRAAGKP
jgi:lipopolysaccharide export system protein LptC